jgi:citrate synthase
MSDDTLSIIDNRTGRRYEIPVREGAIAATDLQRITSDGSATGIVSYDPAFLNTASCKSAITFIDGEQGILRYRGYPIEELAEHSTFLEVAYLLIHGELPNETQRQEWVDAITHHTLLHENIKKLIDGFHHDAHPMGILVGSVGALSTFYPDAKDIAKADSRRLQILRLIAKMPTIAAFAYRHAVGMPYAYPDNDLSYAGNFLNMMWKATELKYEPNPVLEHALDVLLILHADHEQNCSTNAVRAVGSSQVDPYSAVAAGVAALYGPLHGGANEAVLRMLKRIGSKDNIKDFMQGVKDGNERLMGFGHRVYKNYDPRATIIKKACDDVFEVTGVNPLLDIALEVEKIALEDEYFVSRKLYPNVDFYSGLIYEALGLPVDMFPVMFAIPRTAGWIAQWLEMVQDKEQKIARPRQIYTGDRTRDYVSVDQRK